MLFKFSDLELDAGRRQLSRDGVPVKLTKLSFNVLQVLVEAAPNLVTHDELIDKVWGSNRVVSPENLSQRIMMLRQSLGDDAQQPVYIEGLRGQGFRLIPPVESKLAADLHSKSSVSAPPNQSRWPANRLGWFISVAVILLGAALVWLSQGDSYQRQTAGSGGSLSSSVAVLPFANLSPNPENSFYAAGIHEEVLNQLAKLTSLRVISRTSMLRYENTRDSIPAIARELDVDSVIEGSVRYANNRIRVTIQLVDGGSDEHLWSETYDRELKNIFEIESDIARDVAVALRQMVTDEDIARLKKPPTRNLDAYAHYMQGRQAVVYRDEKELKAARAHFQAATELDPDFALAWVGLADSLEWLGGYSLLTDEETFAPRQNAIDHALAIDPALGEAWLSLAGLKSDQGEPEEAEKYFRRSIELSPENAQAYHQYGWFLVHRVGRPEEALPQLRKAVALDPMGPAPEAALVQALWALGRVEEALAIERKRLDTDPKSVALNAAGYSYRLAQLGRLDEAMYWATEAARANSPAFGGRRRVCKATLALGDDLALESCQAALIKDFPSTWQLEYWPELFLYRGQIELFLQKMVELEHRDSSGWAQWQVGLGYLLNNNVEQAREIYAKLLPRYFGTEKLTLESWDLSNATVSGLTLLLSGDTERANYLFDLALQKMQTMHRTRGWSYGAADIIIHVLRGNNGRAKTALREAIDTGWRQDWWRLRGPGFALIEQDPEWQMLIAELNADVAQLRKSYDQHKGDPTYW